jgi:hypothetical protein
MSTPLTVGDPVRLGARELRVFEVFIVRHTGAVWVGAWDRSHEPGRPDKHFTTWRPAEAFTRV